MKPASNEMCSMLRTCSKRKIFAACLTRTVGSSVTTLDRRTLSAHLRPERELENKPRGKDVEGADGDALPKICNLDAKYAEGEVQ